MKKKHKVVERKASEFGAKTRLFVVAKKTYLGFYWDTDDYYFNYDDAEKRCNALNSY